MPLIIQNPFDKDPVLPARMRWSVSKAKLFHKCKRKFFWKYVLGLTPKARANALLFGDYFHQGLGEWYKSKRSSMKRIAERMGEAAKQEIKELGEFYDQSDYEKLTTLVNTLTGMLVGYAKVYAHERKMWNIDRKGIERKEVMDMGDFDFVFKVDLLTIHGKTNFLVEHKTAARIPESYIDKLPLDLQVRGYVYGASHKNGLGKKISKVVYDVVKKCKLRRKGDEPADEFDERIANDYVERPEFYFFRETLMFGKPSLAAFELELMQSHEEYMWYINSRDPLDPRNWRPCDNICNEFFKTCPYQTLCLKGLDKGTAWGFQQYIRDEEDGEEE